MSKQGNLSKEEKMIALSDSLRSVVSKCDCNEARWLVEPVDPSAVGTRLVLEESFGTLPDTTRSRMLREIKHGTCCTHVIATLREVIAYEWLRRLSLSPTYLPNEYAPLTSDLSFEIDSKRFLADVFVTFNPSRTIWFKSENLLGTKDSGDRAQKIAGRLAEKYAKYKDEASHRVLRL